MMYCRHQPISERWFIAAMLAAIALYHVVVGLQGFDMCDEGWSMTGFQQLFGDPQSVQYLFLYYLSDFVGAVWERWFGCFGIAGFRMLAAIFITIISLMVYLTLRRLLSRWSILAGLGVAFLCAWYGIMVFYHNYLTAFLAVAAVCALLRGLNDDSALWIGLSGMLIGMNVFARLPNLSLVSLALLFCLHYFFERNSRRTWLLLGCAVVGFAVGVAAVVALMHANGHLSIFMQALNDGTSAANDADSTHNSARIVTFYLGMYGSIALNGILVASVPLLTVWLARRHPAIVARRWYAWAAAIAYVVLMRLTYLNIYVVYAVATMACVAVVIGRRDDKQMVYLSAAALIVMHALPLGSDYGIENIGENAIYLAAPLTVGLIAQAMRHYRSSADVYRVLQLCALICALFVVKRGVQSIASQCYFDEGWRWQKTCRIAHPLATTLTTERNCLLLNPLLSELEKYVEKDDYLFCFQNLPTLHYLTHTRPYLYNPWVWAYDPSNMAAKLRQAERERKRLPVLVRDKSIVPHWQEYYADWNNDHAPTTYYHKNRRIALIKQFVDRHGYRVVWENEVFQLLLPPDMDEK